MVDARVLKAAAMGVATLLLVASVVSVVALDDSAFAHSAFARTWQRTDKPVEDGQVSRSWIWGGSLTGGMQEPYFESPGGQRLVQYFDKARMEITHPDAVDDGLWYVSTGLLVNELISGQVQVGDTSFLAREPARINVAGDPVGDDNPDSPTYADLASVLAAPPLADGALVTQRLDGNGHATNDPSLAGYNITAAHRVQVTGIDHQIASVFWDFMNSSGPVWEDGASSTASLFPNPYYATGYPVTEAYWSRVYVNAIAQDVLWQCFQRRCMTYTFGNDPNWRVEFGNIGKHYREWRYADNGGNPTATATATATPTETTTPVSTPTEPPPSTDQLYTARLSGGAEVPAIPSGAGGTAWFYVDAGGQSVRYQIVVSAIENITAAHIHLGGTADNGPIVVTLFDGHGAAVTPAGILAEGEFSADDLTGPLQDQPLAALLSALASGDAYVNVRTVAHSTGEIRGQLTVGDELLFRARLAGDNETDPVTTDAAGDALLYYDNVSGLRYQVRVRDIEGVSASHIHLGEAGDDGPVAATLFTAGDAAPIIGDGVLAEGTLEPGDLSGPLEGQSLARLAYELATGGAYVNVHTQEHAAGEIRGQVATWTGGDGSVAFAAELTGRNESPPSGSDARGEGLFRWNEDGSLSYELIVAELDSPIAAHIHLGAFDVNGPVVVTLFGGPDDSGEQNGVIAAGDIDPADFVDALAGFPIQRLVYELATGNAYVNVHTTGVPSGEIRGQSELVVGAVWVAHLDGASEEPPVTTDAAGVAVLTLDRDGQSMHYLLIVSNLADATAANMHIVTNDNVGPIIASLWEESGATPGVENGVLAEGFIDEASLRGPLTGSDFSDLVDQIRDGDTYVNILTDEYPVGEIRGTIE